MVTPSISGNANVLHGPNGLANSGIGSIQSAAIRQTAILVGNTAINALSNFVPDPIREKISTINDQYQAVRGVTAQGNIKLAAFLALQYTFEHASSALIGAIIPEEVQEQIDVEELLGNQFP